MRDKFKDFKAKLMLNIRFTCDKYEDNLPKKVVII